MVEALCAFERRGRAYIAYAAVVTFGADIESIGVVDDVLCAACSDETFDPGGIGSFVVFLRYVASDALLAMFCRCVGIEYAVPTFAIFAHDRYGARIVTGTTGDNWANGDDSLVRGPSNFSRKCRV